MSDMVTDGAFTLLRGATGFHRPKEGPLPDTNLRAFRTALYAAARAAGGRVDEVEEQEYPQTFHTASVIHDYAGEGVVLCHAHHPWVPFAHERREWYRDEFVPPPLWAHPFAVLGFTALSTEQFITPISDLDTSLFSRSEWHQIGFFPITTLGGALFNAWD
ncbi:hypothetical protein [Streptomyces sp. NPDC055749]